MKNTNITEKIKRIIIDLLEEDENLNKMIFSKIISERLNQDYTSLCNIFIKEQGTTIEDFIIKTKINFAKEFLQKDEENINKIAIKLENCCTSQLSNFFKNKANKKSNQDKKGIILKKEMKKQIKLQL